jgi:hypothetical protein
MKNADRRLRPREVTNGDFGHTWFEAGGGILINRGSFPSGHAIGAFTMATVIAERYRQHRWGSLGGVWVGKRDWILADHATGALPVGHICRGCPGLHGEPLCCPSKAIGGFWRRMSRSHEAGDEVRTDGYKNACHGIEEVVAAAANGARHDSIDSLFDRPLHLYRVLRVFRGRSRGRREGRQGLEGDRHRLRRTAADLLTIICAKTSPAAPRVPRVANRPNDAQPEVLLPCR